jgi:hypothetical protein
MRDGEPIAGCASLYIIAAIGSRMMLFLWDPLNWVQQGPRLSIRSVQSQALWHINAGIKAIVRGSWVNSTTGEIRVTGALELDCFSRDMLGNRQWVPKRRADLGAIEEVLVGIQSSGLI